MGAGRDSNIQHSCNTSHVACYYGRTQDISVAQHLGVVRKAPGDGACFWHSIAHGGKDAEEWTEQAGMEIKHHVMQYVNNNAELVGRLLGGSSQVAASILQDWHAWDAWADGRAPPVITACYRVSVMILNVHDQCVELFSPVASAADVEEVWVLRYERDHYDFLQVNDLAALNHVIEQCALQPLTDSTPRPSLRGGAMVTATASAQSLHSTPRLQLWPGVTSKADLKRGLCHTINVGGLRTSLQTVMAGLCDGDHVVCVQETRLSKQNQRSLNSQLIKTGWHALWGAPARMCRDRRGRWGVDKRHPGVCILATETCSVYPLNCRNARTQTWIDTGRLQLAQVHLKKDRRFVLINLYAPSGSQGAKMRDVCFKDLADELALWHEEEILLAGDFQEDVRFTQLMLRLSVHGWKCPHLVDENGTQADSTYSSAGHMTRIDAILTSPDLPLAHPFILVTPLAGMQHSLLSCALPLEVSERHPRVAYPSSH